MGAIGRFLRDEQGQDLVEYTLIVALVALLSAGFFAAGGESVSRIWRRANQILAPHGHSDDH